MKGASAVRRPVGAHSGADAGARDGSEAARTLRRCSFIAATASRRPREQQHQRRHRRGSAIYCVRPATACELADFQSGQG